MDKERRNVKRAVDAQTNEKISGRRCVSDVENDEKFNRLIAAYEHIIKLYINKFHLHEEFDDVMQEGRIAIYKAIKTYNGRKGANLLTYISVCVQRRLLSYIRNKQAKKMKPYTRRIASTNRIRASCSFRVEETVLTKIHFEQAYQKVKMQIDPVELEIYNKYVYGYSIAELCQMYGLQRKTLYLIFGRVRKKLRKELDITNY